MDKLRKFDLKRSRSYIWRKKDVDSLVNSESLFERKFDMIGRNRNNRRDISVLYQIINEQ